MTLPVMPSATRGRWLCALALAGAVVVTASADAQDNDDGLGRLFTTPAERQALDSLRQRGPLVPVAPVEQVEAPLPPDAEPAVLPDVTVSGLVLRSDGRASAWVNGRVVDDGGQSFEGVLVSARRGERSVELVLPDSGQALRVRPGQRIQVNSGRVLESYEYAADEDSPSVFDEEDGAAAADEPAPRDAAASLAETTERTLEAIRTLRDLFSGITGEGR